MTVLVFGKTGQVAMELAALGGVTCLGREEADLGTPEACVAAIEHARPDAVINAAAYTAVDKAEEDEATALRVNGTAPTAMAQCCARLGIPFVHLSTDYVFDGAGAAPFAPDHHPAPLNAYGRTKLAGEQGVRASGATYAVLRTSWVFSAAGNNFVKTMLRLSGTRDALSVVGDQFGGPTPARAIARASMAIAAQLRANPSKAGTYHFAGAPDISWAGFARAIFAQAGRATSVTPIPSAAYPTAAVRPANSRMDCRAVTRVFGISRPDWGAELGAVLKELEVAS